MNLVNGVPQPFFWDPVLFVNFFGSGTILYTVREYNNGCAGPAGDTVQVDLFGPPNIGILGPNKVCKGDTVSYNVLFTNNTYYEWSTNPSTTIVDTSNNIIKVVFDSVGSNQIGVLIVNPCGNDQGTKTILVKDYPPAAAGLDQVVCAGTPVTLTANNLSGVSYTWGYVGGAEIGSGNPKVVTPNDTTTYYVKVKLNLTPPGCASYDTITVFTESPPPPVVDTLHICFGETATLAADTGQGYTYLWNTGETSQIISKTDSGTYQVDITMPGEVCAKTQIFLLDVDTCYIPLKLPNVFTPNGDGANDFWIPYPIGNFDKFEIIVYNRWGTVVFKTTDPKFKWDAKDLNGDLVSEGVYYYVATTQYVDKHQELHGTVSVLNEKK